MSRRHILLAALPLAAMLAPVSSMAAGTESTPADSASAAVATVWADYLGPALAASYGDAAVAADDYVRGVSETLSMNKPDPYRRGQVEGVQLASRLAEIESMGIPVDRAVFLDNLLTALKGGSTGFDATSANNYMEQRLRAHKAQVDADFLAQQQQFLAANSTREGVVRTPSGLLFEVLVEGEGASPVASDKVKVNYTGRLADGTEFDSTKGNPVEFGVSQLVAGFTEGLQLMKPGGTYRLIIPADIAYGDRGAAGVIPPGAVLDFTVELVDIVK